MRSIRSTVVTRFLGVALAGIFLVACSRNPPPVEPDAPPPPPPTDQAALTPPPPPARPQTPQTPQPPPVIVDEDEFASRSLEDLNRESPLQPVFFEYDQSEISPQGRSVLQANAVILRQYPNWVITIEGHCDERGSPEYNLSLGERRALTAQEYLIGMGIRDDRINTVSYGKEFPFDPRSNPEAWERNRRAHFVITNR